MNTETTELQRTLNDVWSTAFEPNVKALSSKQLAKMLETLKREWMARSREVKK